MKSKVATTLRIFLKILCFYYLLKICEHRNPKHIAQTVMLDRHAWERLGELAVAAHIILSNDLFILITQGKGG